MEIESDFSHCLEYSVTELIDRGLYKDALKLIDSTHHEKTPQIILNEARCYFYLKKSLHALEVLKQAEEKGWDLNPFFDLKGKCLYQLHEWERALSAFEAAAEALSSPSIRQWITRCQAHIVVENNPESEHIIHFEPPIIIDVRREWYQTSLTVAVVIYVREVLETDLKVQYSPKHVDIDISQAKPISLHLSLSKEIVPEQSSSYITPSKIELKMKKAVPGTWSHFEED